MKAHRTIAAAIVLAATTAGCAHAPESAGPRVAIQVTEKGFEPAVVTIPAGHPATLVVTRTTDQTCATDFVMTSRHIRKKLPLHQAVEIRLDAQRPGDLEYGCAMEMYKGTVHVE